MDEGKVCIVFFYHNEYVDKDWWLRNMTATGRNKYKKWSKKVFENPCAKNLSWTFEYHAFEAEVRIDD